MTDPGAALNAEIRDISAVLLTVIDRLRVVTDVSLSQIPNRDLRAAFMRDLGLLRDALDDAAATYSKRCTGCDRDKPPTSFYRDRSKPDGMGPRCRECVTAARNPRAARVPLTA